MAEAAPGAHDSHKAPPKVALRTCPLSTRDLVGKVLAFCETVNGIEFYAYQKTLAYRIIESLLLRDGASITALFSRQSGKSETVSSVGLGLCLLLPTLARIWPDDERLMMYKGGILIGVFAPKADLSGPIYLKMRNRAESERVQAIMADPDLDIGLVQSRGDAMGFTNGSAVRAQTASDTTLTEGATYHLILIDEAQRVSKAKVLKEIGPMLAATNGTMVKIGTAWMSRGGFHNDIQFNLDQEEQGGPKNHYQFDYEQVIAEKRSTYNRQKRDFEAGRRQSPPDPFHLNYEKWVMAELARLGGNKDAEEFKMNFRLKWQDSRVVAIKESLLRDQSLSGEEMNVPKHFGFQVAGLDVAKEQDSTVLTVMEVDLTQPLMDEGQVARDADDDGEQVLYFNKYILGWLEQQGSFEGKQYKAIVDFLGNYSVSFMYVDATGIGDPVCERLQVLLEPMGIEVEPFRFTMASKSDLFKYYLQELNAHRVWSPAGEETIKSAEHQKFMAEHINLEREYHGAYLVCSAPPGEHDDYPCSGALAVLASKKRVASMPVVEMEQQVFYGEARTGGRVAGRASRYLSRRAR